MKTQEIKDLENKIKEYYEMLWADLESEEENEEIKQI